MFMIILTSKVLVHKFINHTFWNIHYTYLYYDDSGFLKTISNLSVDIYNYLIIAVSDQKLVSFELGIDDN